MIEILKLSARYRNTGKDVFKEISFKVNKGETVAILGPSGCGKTTLLDIVAGIIGEKDAEIEGKIIKEEGIKIRKVFQEPRLLPWKTVIENVSFGLRCRKEKENIEKISREAVRIVGLDGFEEYSPPQLSVGMQQRVNFARAIVCNPDVLLLDEPFSALDKETKNKVREEFSRIISEKKITSLFVTHDIEEAYSLADKIVVLYGSPSHVSNILNKNDFKRKDIPNNLDYIASLTDYN